MTTNQGEVWLSSGVVFEGTVTVTNGSKEPKVLPKGVYKDTTVDLTGAWRAWHGVGWGICCWLIGLLGCPSLCVYLFYLCLLGCICFMYVYVFVCVRVRACG
jgi:hypothetical protein